MRLRIVSWLLTLSFAALGFAACGSDDDTQTTASSGGGSAGACVEGEVRDCFSGSPSAKDVGQCRAGGQTCKDGAWGPCVAEILPAAETCNGFDDDCDGTADEGCPCTPGQQRPCYEGQEGTIDVGICKAGQQGCDAGQWGKCVGQVLPKPGDATCNNLDDDCDGQTDEGNPEGGSPCAVQGALGLCATGLRVCQGGQLQCTQTFFPSQELCDGKDNDCDGLTDEGC